MALLQISYLSDVLQRTVPMRVVTPADKVVGDEYYNAPGHPYKLMILMHGYHGSYVDWTNATRIQKWAETRNFIVAMPSGDNAFYIDYDIRDEHFGEFLGKELYEVMSRMFTISPKREDHFICGLSMGGYGALINGLKYHEAFGYIGALSSGVETFEHTPAEKEELELHDLLKMHLRDKVEENRETERNPRWLAQKLMDAHVADPDHNHLPKIYMTCGLQDELLISNQRLAAGLSKMGYDVTYVEHPGEHAWTYWDPELQDILNWLPLELSAEGLDSGHIATELSPDLSSTEV